eukprot:CAMPEP_0198303544 /NCGR_PEP_ID=MMETSP1449-20131203/56939_1 /TAXON_ID=420275 /ORGANISM="Attheya septentrionalis, Strain CCMP2084" /LENGTH=603 /DNA_ID=CAMNT_0044006039 /DNA_START=634 /DNA_END=2445 /DNA_ORIENTATION=-
MSTEPPPEEVASASEPVANPPAAGPSERKQDDEGAYPSDGGKESGDGDNTENASLEHQQAASQQAGYQQHMNVQQQGAYYYQQGTPEPPSPTAAGGYDMNPFLQQHAALLQQQGANPFSSNPQYSAGIPLPPLSPAVNNQNNASSNISMGIIPPASPLFPGTARSFPSSGIDRQHQLDSRMLTNTRGGAPPSPSLPYLVSPPLGPTAPSYSMYQGYGGNQNSPEQTGWSDRANHQQQQMYLQSGGTPSPQLTGMPAQYQLGSRSNNRSTSFDEMLPPSAVDQQEHGGYSPYTGAQVSPNGTAGSLFTIQQPWGSNVGNDAYYGRQQLYHGQYQVGSGHPPPRHTGQPSLAQPGAMPFYATTTPGPPIQTTASNKGPDGANLFIFHIPNHFTNLDMWQLFCSYGNLLSVRIMVEKDTGRSRGFGFVSYDSPESAAMAIKELNGFVIGNKRLKVQHKQIRASDHSGSQQEPFYVGAPFVNEAGFLQGPGENTLIADTGTQGVPGTGQAPLGSSQWYENPNPLETAVDSNPDISGIVGNHTSRGGSPNDNAPVMPVTNSVGVGEATVDSNASDPSHENPSAGSGTRALSPLANLDPIRNALPDVTD